MIETMALSTPFTELFSLRYPIALAPMGGSAGGALASAVSNAGGLGLLGGGSGDLAWLDRELPVVAKGTRKPWGVGFQSWAVNVATVEHALRWNPRAVMLSFGDPGPFTEPIRRAGAALILQVTDLEEARQAVDLGADVIVAQPPKYTGRTLAHPFLDQWRGREGELAADPEARHAYRAGVERGELPPMPVWAGEAIDLINDLPSAADLVAGIAAHAEQALARALTR
jgi:Nitronate monooxygenase